MKKGTIVRLLEDTAFYKKGQKATVVDECEGSDKMHVIYEGEEDIEGYDTVPKSLFEVCE